MYFVALSQLNYLAIISKRRELVQVDGRLTHLGNLLAGAFARASVGFILMPFTVIKVRYESTAYQLGSLPLALADLWKREGLAGLFRGWGATALRDAPQAGLYVLCFEAIRSPFSNQASINMGAGMAAGFLSCALTQPFDLIKTRIQVQPQQYRNFMQAARKVWLEEGIRGFGTGMMTRVVRKSLSSAITWTVYEEIRRLHK